MRADARRNLERICSAASEVFEERGLDAPLEDIARRAGVSVGTIYHRFGSREGLIDAVVADVAAQKLDTAMAAITGTTSWERFCSYVFALGESQAADPWFNEVFARRYPDADVLREVNGRAVTHGESLMRQAQSDGSLRGDLTATDLDRLIWLNAQSIRLDPDWWRRGLGFLLDGLATERSAA
ncbi:TetR family transcriptional regulator [Nocardia neocaledoniensis NBRC 108232]|uniref:TetR family transcriptional regulator n=1 Tax=Nocardia neocaledoniensis TaxID=236511 RepID=A0A317NWV5_9NOCA|nr:TetR/AcrR family transcriptional regulator [Nocardia neocaledoniensis]PWV79721.1 TetR family transcriptional regulator [Nocardia neocaledoniensis]GEM31507.1 TetR family transcriptional regulator [Nocardia neocaledoniensis NBRC 108232]